jgi:hypothetical protein
VTRRKRWACCRTISDPRLGRLDNVVIIRKYSSFDAINSDTTFAAAMRRITPDSTKRKAVNDAFNSIFGSGLHHDEIYAEVTKQ